MVSAFLKPQGPAFDALALALGQFEVAASKETFAELVQVLERDKFDRYLSRAQRAQRLELFAQAVSFWQVSTQVRRSSDPRDDKFLALAVDAQAVAIVTGDKKDLLVLETHEGIPILSLRAFLGNG